MLANVRLNREIVAAAREHGVAQTERRLPRRQQDFDPARALGERAEGLAEALAVHGPGA